jgi:plasmid stabilization system protein ParE
MRITYSLQILDWAKRDFENIFVYLSRERPSAAAKFVLTFEERIQSLRWLPARFPKIRERFPSRRTYRHILFYPYRVIYRVQHRTVFIMRVMHQAQLLTKVE